MRYAFTEKAQLPSIDCDNHKPASRMVFTPEELGDLKGVFAPYIIQRRVTPPVYRKGEDLSCVVFSKGESTATMFVVVKQLMPGTVPSYTINYGLGYEPGFTQNFDEVLRLGRMHIDRVFSAPEEALQSGYGLT
ncbi:MAG: hypothetical protein WC989_08415 [Micavibrio sp.]